VKAVLDWVGARVHSSCIARGAPFARLRFKIAVGVVCPIVCAEEAIIMTLDRLRLSVADARNLAEGALRGIGYDNDEARIIADHVIEAAMCGYEYSGLAKILNVPESEHFRLPRRSMKMLRETEVSLAFDGGNNVGMLALFHAAQATIKKTAAHGIALVSVTDAWMSGRGAYYVEMIAKHGLVAIHTASSSPLVAPPGGIRPVLGTNPIAIAVPSSRGPIVLDMGTSAYMMTEVMLRERLGELLPEGVALGPGGEPTRDPTAARRGALLPFGGYKGFGLALMMQALGLLAGSGSDAESDYGYLFVAFRPDLFGPADAFERQVTQLIERIKATPRQPGVDDIRIPSERAFRSRERALREGLEIDRVVFDALVALRTL
jgi:LDH2 family malate/lactate/ureidoglycolate dehydrogenase